MAKMCTNQDLNYQFNLDLSDLNRCPTKYQAQSQSSYKISVDSAYKDNQLFPIDAATLVSTGLKLRVILNTNFIENQTYRDYWDDYYNPITQYGIYGRWAVASEYSDTMVQVFGGGSRLELGREYTYESDVRIPNPYGTGLFFNDIGIESFAIWLGESGRPSARTWECRLEIQYYQYESAIGSGWSSLSGSNGEGTSDKFLQYPEYLTGEEIPAPSDKYAYWVPINGQGYPTDDNGIFELQIKPIRTYTPY